MLSYKGQELEKYKKDNLQIQPGWNQRDFTSRVN